MDNWMPGRTLYMPLVTDRYVDGENTFGQFVNSQSFYRGSRPFDLNYKSNASGPKTSPNYYGEVVAYAQPEIRDYMADPYTRAVCVGMYFELFQPGGQGAVFNIGREIFDFKFLFDMPNENGELSAANSNIVYPAPYKLRDALNGNTMQLL